MADIKERDELLAFVAEQYYLEDLKQTDIAGKIGLTRSAVSRILTEARKKGVVEFVVHYPIQYNQKLEDKLKTELGLKYASVLEFGAYPENADLKKKLGKAASRLLTFLIKPGDQIGVAWGTTVQATIEAFKAIPIADTKVVQLVGVLGSTRHSYSPQTLVEELAEKIGGEGFYLYSPFIVENHTTATSLLEDPVVEQSVSRGEESDIALVGIGATSPAFCSLYQKKHISKQDLDGIRSSDASGDVCAIYFNTRGELVNIAFHQRRIGISSDGLRKIPLRLGVAGGIEKAEAILGAACGGFINALVTDSITASRVLELASIHCHNNQG